MKKALIIIVDKRKEKQVMEIARNAGARGGTIMRGKGASKYSKKSFLGLDIEIDKDVILILAKLSIIRVIMDSLNDELDFNKPNSGIAFVLDVNSSLGVVAK